MYYTLSLNRRYWRTVLAGLCLLAVLALAQGSAHALPQDITMTPTSVDQVIKPGDTYQGSFRIVDQGKTAYTFHVYATPYRVDSEAYTPDFTVLPNAPNVTSWFNFSQAEGHISPGQSILIHYTVILPKSTPPGGYYAAAFAETQYPKSKSSSITLNERVGELFYIQAAGPVAKKGELLTWKSNLFQSPPLTSTIRLQNDGGVHYKANINYQVSDIFGHPKYKLNTAKEILPQTIRRVTISWSNTPSIGLFKVTGKVSFLGQTKSLGTKWVLVMSGSALAVAAAVVILIVAVFLFSRRKRSKKSKK